MNKKYLDKYISESDRKSIEELIAEVEKHTIGEVCISIKKKKPILKTKKPIHELAHKEFFKLGLHKTEHRSAILIYIILEHKQFYLLADEGIHKKVENDTWQNIKERMAVEMKNASFAAGLKLGIKEIGKVLKHYMPQTGTDTNELTNNIHY